VYLIYPSVKNIKEAVLSLYNDRDKLAGLSSNCRKFAEERFSEHNMYSLLEAYGLK
jgi:glycosyltransferase involved in cell wall biosynthesis